MGPFIIWFTATISTNAFDFFLICMCIMLCKKSWINFNWVSKHFFLLLMLMHWMKRKISHQTFMTKRNVHNGFSFFSFYPHNSPLSLLLNESNVMCTDKKYQQNGKCNWVLVRELQCCIALHMFLTERHIWVYNCSDGISFVLVSL